MKKLLLLTFTIAFTAQVHAQSISGKLVDSADGKPIEDATVSINNGRFFVKTNKEGIYIFKKVKSGENKISFSHNKYAEITMPITIKEEGNTELNAEMVYDTQADMQEDIMQMLAEYDLNDEEGESQNVSSLLAQKGDVFAATASYAFSPARYRIRGYAQSYESTYINGVNFNDAERGRFNYSSLGGLNDASRNKDVIRGFDANTFTYGNLGGSTDIDMRASSFAAGGKVSLAGTNRAYWLRAMATYATGLMSNGWAFAGTLGYRWSHEGRTEGTFYNSGGYFLSAEKRINNRHILSLVTYGSPTERANSAPLTQETIDLTSIYYNPYWGYQNGKKRNSRIVHSYDPTAILNYEWKIDENQKWKTGIAFHYSMYSNSALTFYNAPDPRPDYYRNLPSYQLDGHYYYGIANESTGFWADPKATNINLYNTLTEQWQNGDAKTTQIDWDAIYQANYANNIVNATGIAKYMLERRHNNLMETALSSVYANQINDNLKLSAGIEAKYSKGMHYKTIDDLLGANQWVDIDPFSDRDISDLAENINLTQSQIANVRQNDVSNPDRIVKEGDIFGYHYDVNVTKALAYIQNEWDFNKLKFHYALKGTFTSFYRLGYMENGRTEYLNQILSAKNSEFEPIVSKGKGNVHNFVDPSFKLGIGYSFSARNRLYANVIAETRSPLPNNYYISSRISDRSIDAFDYNRGSTLKNYFGLSEKILSYDLSYVMSYPIVRARVSLYRTHSIGGVEFNGYYNDEYRTFINHVMYNVDKIYQGFELGAAFKIGPMFTISAAFAYNDAHYTDNAIGIESAENGMTLGDNGVQELKDRILLKDLKVASGPQLVGNLKLNFFHSKMWFAELSVSYLDQNYLGIAPSLYSQGIMTGTRADGTAVAVHYTDYQKTVLGQQESLVDPNWYNRFLVDASVGKLIYFPNGKSLNINLSLNNITNNTHMKTGGYQQARIPTTTYRGNSYVSNNVYKYPAKYYYAWGFNFFLNVGFRF